MPGELPDYLEGTQKAYAAGYTAGLLAGLWRVERENLSLIGRASISTRHCAINRLITHVEATGELPEEA